MGDSRLGATRQLPVNGRLESCPAASRLEGLRRDGVIVLWPPAASAIVPPVLR